MARTKIIEKLLNEYRLTIRNEDDFAERGVYVISLLKVLSGFFIIFLLSLIITFFLGRYVFTEFYTSKDFEEEMRKEQMTSDLFLKLDTLEKQIRTKDQFISSFKYLIGGSNDSAISSIDIIQPSVQPEDMSKYVAPGRYNKRLQGVSEIYFMPPIIGYGVARAFDYSSQHFGVDVVAQEGEPILSVADGTVIFASWTDETGHVIVVQHSNDITSLYKHNSVLLKRVGDLVKAGDAIAIIGNSGKFTSGAHLHFEMWEGGVAVDPQGYISFQK